MCQTLQKALPQSKEQSQCRVLHVNMIVLAEWSFQKCGSKGDDQRKLINLPIKVGAGPDSWV